MPRALLVVSAFEPAIVADMQRARMLAWELPQCGWDVEVLAPKPGEVRPDIVESDGADFFPPGVTVHHFGSYARAVFEAAGSRSPAWRTLWPLYRRGNALLRDRRFDIVYITTTTFPYFGVAPLWKKKFGVPYVLDFHDPWIRIGGERPKHSEPMRRLAYALSTRMERSAVSNADGLVSVSETYIEQLRQRYGALAPQWMAPTKNAVIPFGALESDLRRVGATSLQQTTPTDHIRVVYVGVGGHVMARAFEELCGALSSLRRNGNPVVERLRIELYGTMYGWEPGDPRWLYDIATAMGVGDLVREQPSRVSFRRSIELMLGADAALVLGVDDEGYLPSKLFHYALAGKPLLLCLHAGSPAIRYARRMGHTAHVLTFGGGAPAALGEEEVAAFLRHVSEGATVDRREALAPFLAPTMARRHVELFEACTASRGEA